MRVTFATQPFAGGGRLLEFLRDALDDPDTSQVTIVVAWAKRSGIRLIEDSARQFISRGGQLRAVVGISEGGATRQGLEMIFALATASYVFHDRQATFHPKIYLSQKLATAQVWLGSNNLTRGGVAANHEAALKLDLDLADRDDNALLIEIENYIDVLLNQVDLCKPLSQALIAELSSHQKYQIGDEDKHRARVQVETDSVTEDEYQEKGEVFGTATSPRMPIPTSGSTRKKSVTRRTTTRTTSVGASTVTVIRRWFKQMVASDAQHPPTGSPTGNLRLSKANNPIDHRDWFRSALFGGATWMKVLMPGGTGEETIVNFDVKIHGSALGGFDLRVSHAPWRIAGQNNVPTVLHWGQDLNPILRNTDFTGDYVTLEQLSDGTLRLTISSSPLGPSLP